MYLKEHEPKIAALQGMINTCNGQRMLRRSYEKYKQTTYLYTTTNESVNDIAKKLHLHSGSFRSFLKRHYAKSIKKDKGTIASAKRYSRTYYLREPQAFVNALVKINPSIEVYQQ